MQQSEKLNDEMIINPSTGAPVYNNIANCLDITRKHAEAADAKLDKLAAGVAIDYDLLADKVVAKLADKLAQ